MLKFRGFRADTDSVLLTPFHEVPRSRFLRRMFAPALGVFGVGMIVMGLLATSPEIQPARKPSSSIIPAPRVQVRGDVMTASLLQMVYTVDSWIQIPQVCWNGNTVNDFQKTQCNEYWDRAFRSAGVSSIPVVLVAVFLMIGLDQLNMLYRRSRKTITKGQAWNAGTVTQPAEAPQDFFGWAFCLRPIMVQLQDKEKTQLKVYIPMEASIPLPGQTLAIFEGGVWMGSKRYVGLLYAPHLAVVAGVR